MFKHELYRLKNNNQHIQALSVERQVYWLKTRVPDQKSANQIPIFKTFP